MKPKTMRKILRRFQRLPLHHIDTNILVESGKETKLGNICAAYLNRVGYKYNGVLCSSVLGEFLLHVLKDIKESEERKFMLDFIDKMSKKTKCGYSSLKYESFHIVDKIKEIDSRVEDMDAVHLANCIQDRATAFVTFDEKLVGNLQLEKEFNINIFKIQKNFDYFSLIFSAICLRLISLTNSSNSGSSKSFLFGCMIFVSKVLLHDLCYKSVYSLVYRMV